MLGEEVTGEWGFEQRVRNENWNNLFDFDPGRDDQQNQIRYRTRLWIRMPVGSHIDLFAAVNQETNQVFVPRRPWRFDEVVIENLYLDFKRLLRPGLSLRIGRQNLVRGEGFLLLEGGPFDGSRSIYFNAVDLAYSWRKSKLEWMGIINPSSDRYLPRIHDRCKPLIEWDEKAAGMYFTDQNLPKTTLEAYSFWKIESDDRRTPAHPQFRQDRRFLTAGGRATRQFGPWTGTGEVALQRGPPRDGSRIAASAGYAHLKRSFNGARKPYLLAGYWRLSGDDPRTTDVIEDWNPIFSRWPKWSELYLYTLFRERGVGYWTNLGSLQMEAGFSPAKPLNCRFTLFRMTSAHPFPGDPGLYGKGTRRGDNLQARLDWKASPHWSGHVLYEAMLPGNFYASRSHAHFLRFEMIYSLTGHWESH